MGRIKKSSHHVIAFIIGFIIVFFVIYGAFSLFLKYYPAGFSSLFYKKSDAIFYEEGSSSSSSSQSSAPATVKSNISYTSIDELKNKITDEPQSITIIDTRKVEDFNQGHIAGSLSFPFDTLDQKYTEIDKNKEIYAISPCNACGQASDEQIFEKLKNLGFGQIKVVQGGVKAWQDNGNQVTTQ